MKTTDRSMKIKLKSLIRKKKRKRKTEKKGETYTPPPAAESVTYGIEMFKADSSDEKIEAEVKLQYPNASSDELAGYISERKKNVTPLLQCMKAVICHGWTKVKTKIKLKTITHV